MQQEKQNPNYFAILTANVRYDKTLKANEKLLFAEISSLTHVTGRCWATNKYFSELFGVSTTSISKWISNLIKRGYLDSKMIYDKKSEKTAKRYLTIVKGGVEDMFKTPFEEKFKHNNTSINNKIEDREKAFKIEILEEAKALEKELPIEQQKKFFNYWSERNRTKSKMKFEMEKTWETKKRLKSWQSNFLKFNGNNNEEEQPVFKMKK